jgi:acyl-homoserine lactone acylase PvdQ
VRRSIRSILVVLSVSLVVPAAAAAAPGDTARYILPPGNFGGIPFTDESTDQLPLYDALTPLRGHVTAADIEKNYLPENFQPVGATHEEATGRPGLKLIYDDYGIPHIYGQTRADVAFGSGWATARDRGLLLQVGRGPARVAVADVPGIDAFSLVTGAKPFVPSPETEDLVTKEVDGLVTTYGDKGRQIIADAQAYADGINAYNKLHNLLQDQPPANVNDVVAVTAFIGSIFGAGGGGEARNGELLAKLQQGLGRVRGYKAWDDVMLADDPEAPTTISRPFHYGPFTGGKVTGSVTIDPGSITSVDPRTPGSVDAAAAPPRKRASNFLAVAPRRSATRNSLTVMGPQLGYYYPEIVEQRDLHGPGMNAQGVSVPGLGMYILIGRTKDYAWSLTSAGHDVRDVFAEQLCEPDGSTPTRASTHYLYKGQCRAFDDVNAGTLGATPLKYKASVHGNVIGTATVGGKPYALARKRSTFGKDGLNLAALHDMTSGQATTPRRFWHAANEFNFTFNWAYVSRRATAYFSSGLLPRRAPGLDRRLTTLGNGKYDWRGFLSEREHPHDVSGPGGLLLNWNNRSAPGFMHGDDEPYGSIQHVQLFSRFPWKVKLADDVSIMNRAATEDGRATVWPVVSRVLHTGPAPNALDSQVVDYLDDWVADDAPRVDADNDTFYDDAGPTVMDKLWPMIGNAVVRPVLGNLTPDVNNVRSVENDPSYAYKDLRTLLHDHVRGKFHLRYCGNGSLSACRASLWAAVDQTASALAAQFGNQNPSSWLTKAALTSFVPGLLTTKFRATNRPTFQQVLEFQHERGWGH